MARSSRASAIATAKPKITPSPRPKARPIPSPATCSPSAGSPADLRGVASTVRCGPFLDGRNLLAWNPAQVRGLISDVAQADLEINTPAGFVPDTYFYYIGRYRDSVPPDQIRHEVLRGLTPDSTPSYTEPDFVLQAILLMVQPFNVKVNQLLAAIKNGTATSAQLAYFHNLISVVFRQEGAELVNGIHGYGGFNPNNSMLLQKLNEFGLSALTPK